MNNTNNLWVEYLFYLEESFYEIERGIIIESVIKKFLNWKKKSHSQFQDCIWNEEKREIYIGKWKKRKWIQEETERGGAEQACAAVGHKCNIPIKVAYWMSSNIAIAILELFSIVPPLVIALPTLR